MALNDIPFDAFYVWLESKLMPENELKKRHFPRAHPWVLGTALVYNVPHKHFRSIRVNGQRRCCLCYKVYKVDSSGYQLGSVQCLYHPYKRPPPDKYYVCCGKPSTAEPCLKRNFHVTADVDVNNLTNFLVSNHCLNKERAIYSIDCEFVHTQCGQELASISIVDQNEKIVLNTFVRPDNPIVDYLPHFSNLKPENFTGTSKCVTTIECRKMILNVLGPEVIIIGHGLQEDFLRMGVVHDKVVDTSFMFSHPDGEDFCYSLKTLKEKYLKHDYFPSTNNSKALMDCIVAMRIVRLIYKGQIRLT